MNAYEHYLRAEALLDSCQMPFGTDRDEEGREVETYPGEDEGENAWYRVVPALLAAQAHATLAATDSRAQVIEALASEAEVWADDEDDSGAVLAAWLRARVQP